MDNLEVARRTSDALAKGDMETFLGLHAEDVVVHVPGRSRFSGEIRGRDQVTSLFQQQMEMLDGPPEWEPHDVLANDDHAIVLGVQRYRRGGQTNEQRVAVVVHIEGGQAKEVWVHPEDVYRLDEFFA